MGITISNSQGLWLGFSLWSTLQLLWVIWVYIVWVQKVCIREHSLAKQNVSQEDLTREILVKHSCLHLYWLFAFQLYAGQMHHFAGCEVASYPRKPLQSSIAWVFTHSLSITQPLQLNPTINTRYKRLNKVTIKFGTKLKPTKHIVVNYNFTMLELLNE